MTLPFDNRASSTERGYDSRWKKARLRFLAKHPFCETCRKSHRKTVATVVDHVIPHHLYDAILSKDPAQIATARKRFWDQKNWSAICAPCHDSAKKRLERSGLVVGCDYDGIPLDPGSHWAR